MRVNPSCVAEESERTRVRDALEASAAPAEPAAPEEAPGALPFAVSAEADKDWFAAATVGAAERLGMSGYVHWDVDQFLDPATTARHTLSGGCCDEFLGASAGRGETDGAGLEICAVSIAAAQSGARLAGGAGNENSSDGARCADFGWAVARRALTARAGVRMSTVILAAVCHEM